MKRNFYMDDFEDLIKQKADQYRMYPSEKVWKEINRSLHSRRKWYWSGFILLLSGVSYFAIQQLITPASGIKLAKNTNTSANGNSREQAKVIPIPSFETIAPAPLTIQTVIANTQPSAVVIQLDPINPANNGTSLLPAEKLQQAGHVATSYAPLHDFELTLQQPFPLTFETSEPVVIEQDASNRDQVTASSPKMLRTSESIDSEASQKINWLQEIAVYELLAPRTKRTSLQFSFAPTMNYRKLTGSRNVNMRSDAKSIPIAMNIEGDLNRLVNHKPALGFELGSSILYASNKNLTLKAGLQFNYSRYDIMAYSSYSTEIATIALSSEFAAGTDSITNFTRIRNFGGDAHQDLQNQYFQFSVPVGMEYRLLGNDRLQVKVAGTIQPTYLINRNSYLITTDYKNYTREPSLVRRWNVNTSAEAFISYQAAGLKWQAGPQFRYQLLSSYSDKYPIKEYLMEYGIKVGVSKTIR